MFFLTCFIYLINKGGRSERTKRYPPGNSNAIAYLPKTCILIVTLKNISEDRF